MAHSAHVVSTLLLLCLLGLLVHPLCAYDTGFDLLYTSNVEEVQDLEVTFDKPLPEWMNGDVYHNGLGQFEMGSRNITHFFDAYAKLHSWKLTGGSEKAFFTTTFVRTGYYNDSMEINDVAPYMLFAKPKPKFTGKNIWQTQMKNGMDNANVNLFKMGDDLVAVADFARMYVIDEAGLNTVARFDPQIPGVPSSGVDNSHLSTAHPVPEHGTSNWINIVTEGQPLNGSTLRVVRCKGASTRELITSIRFKGRTPYMHSFAATEKYVILFVNPVSMDFLRSVITGQPMEALTWTEGKPTEVHLVEIATGNVQVIEAEPFFGLHYANTYASSDNTITVDVVTYPNVSIMQVQTLDYLLDPTGRDMIPTETTRLKRYVIDLNSTTVEAVELPINTKAPSASKLDFPVFNELYRYKKYCYIYGVAQKMDEVHFTKWSLVKKDTCDSAGDQVWYKPNFYPGEPWFVPRPGAEKEDDGHLMVVMLDGEKGRSYLAVFDAQTLEEVNKAYLPYHLPMTLHGRYLETTQPVESTTQSNVETTTDEDSGTQSLSAFPVQCWLVALSLMSILLQRGYLM